MTSQMSITQGLAELKLLDKRLNKGLEDVSWMAVSTKNKKVSEEELKKTASAEYQSYLSLVKRRDTIKRAIVLSNANTTVCIASSWSGTVAEAIEYKSSLMYKKKLLAKMPRVPYPIACAIATSCTDMTGRNSQSSGVLLLVVEK